MFLEIAERAVLKGAHEEKTQLSQFEREIFCCFIWFNLKARVYLGHFSLFMLWKKIWNL